MSDFRYSDDGREPAVYDPNTPRTIHFALTAEEATGLIERAIFTEPLDPQAEAWAKAGARRLIAAMDRQGVGPPDRYGAEPG